MLVSKIYSIKSKSYIQLRLNQCTMYFKFLSVSMATNDVNNIPFVGQLVVIDVNPWKSLEAPDMWTRLLDSWLSSV
jgi:hypothetical protein